MTVLHSLYRGGVVVAEDNVNASTNNMFSPSQSPLLLVPRLSLPFSGRSLLLPQQTTGAIPHQGKTSGGHGGGGFSRQTSDEGEEAAMDADKSCGAGVVCEFPVTGRTNGRHRSGGGGGWREG